ncbi:hypothetical protein HRbin23_00014 [bacterium HR23]|nr:hypothetical protein HRbin23_00014 [bacterium HR23]
MRRLALGKGVMLLVAVLGAVGVGVWLSRWAGGALPVLAQPPWPTPPPHLSVPPPLIVPANQVKRVPLPPVEGAQVWLLQPFPRGFLPRINPLPSTTLASGETDPARRIALWLEWESLPATTQLLYRPLDPAQVPPPPEGYRLRRVFALEAFDAEGRPYVPLLRRPWVLRVPLAGLEGPPPEPARLLLARYREEQGRWQLLVTTYRPSGAFLETRLVDMGRYALLEETPFP